MERKKVDIRISVDVEATDDPGLAASVKARVMNLIGVQLTTLGCRTRQCSSANYVQDSHAIISVAGTTNTSLEFVESKVDQLQSPLHAEFAAAVLKRVDMAILRDVASTVLFNQAGSSPSMFQVNELIEEHLQLFSK